MFSQFFALRNDNCLCTRKIDQGLNFCFYMESGCFELYLYSNAFVIKKVTFFCICKRMLPYEYSS